MAKKYFYIKERNNPQLKEPYYVPCGQLTKAEAKAKEESVYGFNIMMKYPSEQEYRDKLKELKDNGFRIAE